MRRFVLLIAMALFGMPTLLANHTQQGIAYLYDYKTKTKKPIGNVRLTVAGAQPAVSQADGTFTLVFDRYGLGDKIGFEKQPYYQGMKVFNKKEVDNWFIVKGQLHLIMCRYEEFELAKNNYYQQGLKAATEKYEKEIVRIKADQKMKEAERNQKLQEAEERLQKVMESLSESSDAMARIDQSELDDAMQEVLDLYEQGNVDEAMQKLEDMKLEEKFVQTLERKQQLEQAVNVAKEDSTLVLNKLRTSVDLSKNIGNWEKAAETLKLLANKLNTYDDIFEYAYYCQKQNDFKDAETYYKKASDLLEKSTDIESNDFLYKKSCLLNNLSALYSNTQRFTEAKDMYKQALEIRQCLAQVNPEAYEPYVATTLNNLANLYSDNHRFTEAENMYKQALETYQRLAQMNPQTYGQYVAGTLNNLAALYSDNHRFTEAKGRYKQALEIYQRLAQKNSKAYKPYVAMTQYNIGCLLIQKEQYADAIPLFEESLEIYRRLTQENPAQQQRLFLSLYNLSNLYANENNHTRCYEVCQELLPMLKEMHESDAENVRDKYASTLGNQSFYAIFMKNFSESEELACEGLSIDSTQHWIASNLAASLLLQGKNSQAESLYRQYKDELKESFLDDFEQFKAVGVIPKEREEDVERIKKMLNE